MQSVKQKNALNVIYATGKDFVKYLSVALTSLMENNKELDLNIYIIFDFVDKSELNTIVSFAKEKYNLNLHLLFLESALFDNYKTNEHVPKVTYFRLLIADIIPANVQTALFIDSDTIVTGSLKQLAEIKFADVNDDKSDESKKYLYAVSEIEVERKINSKRITELGYPTDKHFNAGVLLINLKNWRLKNASQGLIQLAEKHMDNLVYMDQYVLNMYFANKWSELPSAYNALHTIRELPQVPLIIHFAGPSKPWHYMNNHPYKSLYVKYFKMSPFKHTRTFEDFSVAGVFKKHLLETRDYINFYRSGEYKKVRSK